MPVSLGEVIDGKYRIERLLGEGGMGAVFEAENLRIRRRVAIKLLHPHVAEMGDIVKRFEREAQAAGRIGNDHILEVLDLGQLPDGSRYIVMEYLDGEPLSMRIERLGKIPPRELTELALQTLEGLGAAHAAGIVHRDLKPDNIYILKEKASRRDFVKLIDFGISKFQKGGPEGMQMTHTGAVLGTPYYMSPEQAAGSNVVSASTDIYAIGVILYEASTGRRPFDSDSFQQLLFQIVLGDPPDPKTFVPDLDDGFISIIQKAMSRDPTTRFESAEAFALALREWKSSGKAVQVPPKSMTPALAGIVAPTLLGENAPVTGVTANNDTSAAANWAKSDSFDPRPPKKSSKGLILGGVATAAVALVIGVVALLSLRGKPAESAAASEPSAAPAAAAAGVPALPATPEVPAPPSDTSAAPAQTAATRADTPAPPARPGQPPAPPKPGMPPPPPSSAPAAAAVAPPPPPATPEPPAATPPTPPAPPPPPKPPAQQGSDFGY